MYFVYILSNWDDTVLYIGVTGNLQRRLYEHRNGLADGFTKNIMSTNWCTMNAPRMYTAQFPEKNNSRNGRVSKRIPLYQPKILNGLICQLSGTDVPFQEIYSA